ncbi:MAG: hypothetical protein SFW66_10550 [Gammaproteobacteria bacterium]|nr:hypothetical protein [Gammaproteobacteria bacterium]
MLVRQGGFFQQLKAWRSRIFRHGSQRMAGGLCALGIAHDEIILAINRRPNQFQLDELIVVPREKETPLSDILSAVVEKYQLEEMPCTLMLQPHEYELFLLDNPPVKKSEFQSAIRWKILSLIHFPLDEAIIDHFQVPLQKTHNPQQMIMVAVTRKNLLQAYSKAIKQSRLDLTAITIQEMGLRNATVLFDDDLKSTALIYLQDQGSEILIVNNKLLYFHRDLKLRLKEFESLKDFTETSSHEVLDHLALDIQRSFDYYQAQWRKPLPARIYLIIANGVYPIEAMTRYLVKRLAIEVNAFDLRFAITIKQNIPSELINQYLAIIGAVLPQQDIMMKSNDLNNPPESVHKESAHATAD